MKTITYSYQIEEQKEEDLAIKDFVPDELFLYENGIWARINSQSNRCIRLFTIGKESGWVHICTSVRDIDLITKVKRVKLTKLEIEITNDY